MTAIEIEMHQNGDGLSGVVTAHDGRYMFSIMPDGEFFAIFRQCPDERSFWEQVTLPAWLETAIRNRICN